MRLLLPFVRPYRRVLALGGLLAVAEVAAGLAQPWPLKFLVDRVLTPGESVGDPTATITIVCLALGLLAVFSALMDYWSTRLLSSAGLHLANRLRESVFAHLNRLSLGFHGTHRVGDLSARVTGDVDRSQDMIVQFLAVLLPNTFLLVGMVAVLFALDAGFALVALSVTPLLGIAVHRSTGQLRAAARRARKADGQVASATTEHLGAVHLVQAYSLEDQQQERFGRLTTASLSAGLESVRLQARFSPVVDITGMISTVVVLWFGANRVLDGVLTVGELLVFLSYVGSVYKPLKALAKLGQVVSKGAAATERVLDVLAEAPKVADLPGAARAHRFQGAIRFRDVSFAYGDEPVLEGIDLSITPGETLALVGPTGAGKSTIATLVCRLADPTSGAVEFDGVDIRQFNLRSVRRQISMVLQDCTLLHGTVRENIALGHPGASAWQVERAARLALVTEFTSRLPHGLDTMIGERGANLSGGQRQRIAIARAILRDAPILILDEPTSALDTESEQLIVEAIANLPRSRTTLVIAHRLSTIRQADRIAVVDSGRITQIGSHAELLAVPGRYRQLHGAGPLPWTATAPIGGAAATPAPHCPLIDPAFPFGAGEPFDIADDTRKALA